MKPKEIDMNKKIKVKIGSYFVSHFDNYPDAMQFAELAIAGGTDPSEIDIYMTINLINKGEYEDATEN